MKIVNIGPAHPLRGGISRFNESFSQALATSGVDVECISFHYLYPGFIFPGKSQYSFSPAPEIIKIRTLLSPFNPLTWLKTAKLIIAVKPDFVVFHHWMPLFAPVYGILARRIKRKISPRFIAIAHNLIPHEKQPGTILLTRFFLKQIDGVVALSSSVLNDLEQISPGKRGIFLPHPVYDIFGKKIKREEAIKILGLDKDSRYLLFFGLVRDYKGLDLLLEALHFVKAENYQLLVAGEFYDNMSKYTGIIEKYNLSNRVIIRNEYIPDNEVKYYFSVADIVVQPYKTATQSGVTQIAYHFERPMIVTSVGGLPEIVPHKKAGYVVNPDPGEIAEAIDEFLSSESKSAFKTYIKNEKKRFSWIGFVNGFLSFARSL